MRVVLASGSPRRREIMDLIEAAYEVKACNKEEVITSTVPQEVVKELALMKASAVLEEVEGDALVIGADTVVAHEGAILGKPKDEKDACEMIKNLQGKTHEVYTGVALLIRKNQELKTINFPVATNVTIAPMTEKEIKNYVATGEPLDKAGAYAVQGKFAPYIIGLSGDYYNVVGFPISSICSELKKEGIDLIGYGK